MSLENLCKILECPRSHGPLSIKDGKLFSEKEDYFYDSYLEIPWLFKEPDLQLYQWKTGLKNLVFFMQSQAKRLEQEMNKQGLLKLTQTRLESLHQALHHNAEQTLGLLTPLVESEEVIKPDARQLALEKLPHTQHLNSYFHTLFRDWAWDTNEAKFFTEAVLRFFPKDIGDQLVILGSGSSRLGWEIHNHLKIKNTLCVDINPFLFFAAQNILKGKKLDFYEIPIAPLKHNDAVVKQTLQNKIKGNLESFEFLFADGINIPLKKNSVNTILTPWFIDIIPQDFAQLVKKVNSHLEINGYWINLGPLGYDNFRAESYSQEEILEIATSNGFKLIKSEILEMDYLVSPHSSQARKEKVFAFCLQKIIDVNPPPYFHYMPDWIVREDVVIPRSEKMDQIQIKNQVAYQLLNLVDGKRTQSDIIPIMMTSYQMTQEQAEETLVTFLMNYFDNKI